MKRVIYIIWLVLWTDPVWAQVHWYAGGAFRSAPRIRSELGQLTLRTVADREFSVGFSKRWKAHSDAQLGFLSTIHMRSPFYELSAALPYYPLKVPIATYRIESFQVFPFVSISRPLVGGERWSWWARGGPVFSFHAGTELTTTTARTVPGQVPFVLYRLTIQRQSMGIPFARLQGGFSYRLFTRSKTDWMIHPFVQSDLGDRSTIGYQLLPNDPVNRSAGQMQTGIWSLGVICSVGRKR